MENPDGCLDEVYDIMLECWRYKAEERPSFEELLPRLVKINHGLRVDQVGPYLDNNIT